MSADNLVQGILGEEALLLQREKAKQISALVKKFRGDLDLESLIENARLLGEEKNISGMGLALQISDELNKPRFKDGAWSSDGSISTCKDDGDADEVIIKKAEKLYGIVPQENFLGSRLAAISVLIQVFEAK